MRRSPLLVFFFFNDPATPEISPFSLPDALPIPSRFWMNKGCASAPLGGGTVTASPPSSCPAAASPAYPPPLIVLPTAAVSLAGTSLAAAAEIGRAHV